MQSIDVLIWMVHNAFTAQNVDMIFDNIPRKEKTEILMDLLKHRRDYRTFDRIAVRKTDCVRRLYAIKALRETTRHSLIDCCQHFKEIMESETPLIFQIEDNEVTPTNRTKLLASFGEAGLIAYPVLW